MIPPGNHDTFVKVSGAGLDEEFGTLLGDESTTLNELFESPLNERQQRRLKKKGKEQGSRISKKSAQNSIRMPKYCPDLRFFPSIEEQMERFRENRHFFPRKHVNGEKTLEKNKSILEFKTKSQVRNERMIHSKEITVVINTTGQLQPLQLLLI